MGLMLLNNLSLQITRRSHCIFCLPTCILPRRNIAMSPMTFGAEKLEWRGYPMVKQIEDILIRFDTMHERDTHTPHDGIGRALPRLCIASRGKNLCAY